METDDKNKVQKETEEKKPTEKQPTDDQTIHTVNPFTGTQVDITPEDLEGIEKFNEAQTERD